MTIREIATEEEIKILIEPLQEADLNKVTKKRYFFNWKELDNTVSIFKLRLIEDEDIKGLMALIDYPQEQRIEVKLLAVSNENVILKNQKGRKVKEYDRIAGNLLAFASKIAITKYGEKACVSLVPKTLLKEYYIQEYGFLDAGLSVYLELNPLHQLIIKYKL